MLLIKSNSPGPEQGQDVQYVGGINPSETIPIALGKFASLRKPNKKR